jgi:hypothetical protein
MVFYHDYILIFVTVYLSNRPSYFWNSLRVFFIVLVRLGLKKTIIEIVARSVINVARSVVLRVRLDQFDFKLYFLFFRPKGIQKTICRLGPIDRVTVP